MAWFWYYKQHSGTNSTGASDASALKATVWTSETFPRRQGKSHLWLWPSIVICGKHRWEASVQKRHVKGAVKYLPLPLRKEDWKNTCRKKDDLPVTVPPHKHTCELQTPQYPIHFCLNYHRSSSSSPSPLSIQDWTQKAQHARHHFRSSSTSEEEVSASAGSGKGRCTISQRMDEAAWETATSHPACMDTYAANDTEAAAPLLQRGPEVLPACTSCKLLHQHHFSSEMLQ